MRVACGRAAGREQNKEDRERGDTQWHHGILSKHTTDGHVYPTISSDTAADTTAHTKNAKYAADRGTPTETKHVQ